MNCESMNELLGHDHTSLGEMFDALFAALEACDVLESHVRLDRFWARLGMHIRAEHLHLFPAILGALEERPTGAGSEGLSLETAQGLIAQLRRDHDFFMHELAGAMKLLRAMRTDSDARNNPPQFEDLRARVTAVNNRLTAHNQLEEEDVYRWADALLAPTSRADLVLRVQEELENIPPRFDDV
jgi:hypothetical protein